MIQCDLVENVIVRYPGSSFITYYQYTSVGNASKTNKISMPVKAMNLDLSNVSLILVSERDLPKWISVV